MNQVAKHQPPPTAAKASSPNFTVTDLAYSILATIAVYGTALLLFMPAVRYYDPEPQLFMRLVEAQGLDPCVPAEVRSPIFKLAVEAEIERGTCAGGGDAMLRVSYRGIILAWASVPRFCIDGRSLQRPKSPNVATLLVATAEGFVLREELQNMIRAETHALGRAEFDVEGSVPGFGHLRCKTYLFHGEPTEPLPPCRFQKKPREDAW